MAVDTAAADIAAVDIAAVDTVAESAVASAGSNNSGFGGNSDVVDVAVDIVDSDSEYIVDTDCIAVAVAADMDCIVAVALDMDNMAFDIASCIVAVVDSFGKACNNSDYWSDLNNNLVVLEPMEQQHFELVQQRQHLLSFDQFVTLHVLVNSRMYFVCLLGRSSDRSTVFD